MTSENDLPSLTYPFSAEVSPFAADIDGECYRWGDKMGIYRLGDPGDFRRIRVGWLAAHTCPRGTWEGLRLLADWQMWLFAFDDGFCDEAEYGGHPDAMIQRVTSFLGIVEGARSPDDDPFEAALADVVARLADRASGVQLARFVSAVHGYFIAQCWESAHRAAGTLPPLAEYAHMRRHSGAVRTCTALADVAGDFEVSAEDYDHPEVVTLTETAVNITCWANDIISYPKEIRRSKVVQSLPAILGPEDGLAKAARKHDREVGRYLATERRVRVWAGPQLRRYVDDLRFWISGNLEWSMNTGRYWSEETL